MLSAFEQKVGVRKYRKEKRLMAEKIILSDDFDEIEYIVSRGRITDGLTEEGLRDAVFNFIEMKDKYTAVHCKNVARYAAMLAHAAGFSDTDVDTVRDAALLHDVGKVLVDNRILNKEGSLTDREYYQIQSHAEKGMLCLSKFNFREEIIDGAWHHHEKCDGTGYPDGLTKNGILLSTRIISVADTVEAMLGVRPYHRQGYSLQYVIKELKEARGTQLDEDLVDLMLKMIDRGQIEGPVQEEGGLIDKGITGDTAAGKDTAGEGSG